MTVSLILSFVVVFALMLLAKFSTAPMFVLALLWMLILGAENIMQAHTKWNWSKMAAALLLALFVVWAGYFFHVSHLRVRDGKVVWDLNGRAADDWEKFPYQKHTWTLK